MSSQELEAKKRKYIESKSNAQVVANFISKSLNNLDKIKENSLSAYQVDGVDGAGNYIGRLYEKEKRVLNNILNNIIPNVDSKIEELNVAIQEAKIAESLAAETE